MHVEVVRVSIVFLTIVTVVAVSEIIGLVLNANFFFRYRDLTETVPLSKLPKMMQTVEGDAASLTKQCGPAKR